MGVGKTYSASAVIRELNLPTLVVCPKVIIGAWGRVLGALGTDADVINYEMVRTGRTPYGKMDKEFAWDPAVKFLVFDEVHRCKGVDTDNSELLLAAARQKIPTLVMSATPAQTPLDFRALGQLMGLHRGEGKQTLRDFENPLPTFSQWARRNGIRLGAIYGQYIFPGRTEDRARHMTNIAESMRDKIVRVRISDIPDFPQTQITAELYDVAEPAKMEKLYAEMAAAVADLRERKSYDKDPDHPLTKILRIRQELELLMVPSFVGLATDAMEQGMSVPIFVNFKRTIEEIGLRIPHAIRGLGVISGDYTAAQNDATATKFREDKIRVVLCQIDSGGVGISLHDVNGKYPRYSILSPGQSATNLRQATGRVQREGGKSKSIQRIVLPNHPVGRKVHANLQARLNNLDALIDEDLMPENLILDEEKINALGA